VGSAGCDANGFYDIQYLEPDAQGIRRVDPRQPNCTLLQMLTAQDEVQQNWLDMAQGSSGGIRVACASDAIESSTLFRNRRKQSLISIETLQRIIDQDAPTRLEDPNNAQSLTRFCAVNEDDIHKLQMLTQKKTLTGTGTGWTKVCVPERSMREQGPLMGNIAITPTCVTLEQQTTLADELEVCLSAPTVIEDRNAYKANCEAEVQRMYNEYAANCKADEDRRKAACITGSTRDFIVVGGAGTWDEQKKVCKCQSGYLPDAYGRCSNYDYSDFADVDWDSLLYSKK
jgi:hypothetical protein